MDADWWKALDRLDESLKRSHEAARRREEVRQREEAAAAYERHVAEYVQYMAAYEAKAAAAMEAEREAAAKAERDPEAERAMTVKEEDEPAMVIDGVLPEIVPATVLPQIDTVLPKINAVLPQFDAVLPQFCDLGPEIVFPQISKLGFAVPLKIENSVLSGGALADYDGDSRIDGAGRPPRKPPDSFSCSGELCFLAADSWRPVLCPPRKPPDLYLNSGRHGFLISESCKAMMARRPPTKPPDSAEDGGDGLKGHRPWCCSSGSQERVRDGSIPPVTVKGKRPQKSGCLRNPSPIRVGQAQAVQRRNWALLVLGLAGKKKLKQRPRDECLDGFRFRRLLGY